MTHRHLELAHLPNLLPAVQVAWADGIVQDNERRLILELAREDGLTGDPTAMAQLLAWLDAPPHDGEVRQAVRALRSELVEHRTQDVDTVMNRARAVAEADGGLLGFGAIGAEEARTLAWLESVLGAEPSAAISPLPQLRRTDANAPVGRLGTLRALVEEQRQAGKWDFRNWVPEAGRGMWPQPSPRMGDRMPPAVFDIPDAEYREYMDRIVRRYMTSMTPGSWRALRVACHDDTPPLDDAELERLIWETPFSRLLAPLDPEDHTRFGPLAARAARLGTPYKIDHSHLAGQSGFPGIHVAPTVALVAITSDGVRIVAIRVSDRVFAPGDGEAWERARLFFTQGCSLSLVAGVHATLHFPADSVVGVAREVLPANHPVARLIEGHAYLQLPLNYGVRWNPRSYAANNPAEIYNALPVPGESVFEGFSDHYLGLEGNSAYPGYRYPMEAPSFPGPYCAALRAYYDVVLGFCREVVAELDGVDEAVVAWASHLHALLPGFPSPDAVRDPQVLARALAGFVHGSSVWHSLEHHIYSQIPIRHVPHRLRVSPPVGGEAPTSAWERMSTTDLFRQELGRQMFYEAHTIRGILDADYRFVGAGLQWAVSRFHAELRRCEASLPELYRGVDGAIACSIQF